MTAGEQDGRLHPGLHHAIKKFLSAIDLFELIDRGFTAGRARRGCL